MPSPADARGPDPQDHFLVVSTAWQEVGRRKQSLCPGVAKERRGVQSGETGVGRKAGVEVWPEE